MHTEVVTHEENNNFLGGITFCFGEKIHVNDIWLTDGNVEKLKKYGYSTYSKIDTDQLEKVIERVVNESLNKCSLLPSIIDLIIIASNSYSYDRTMEGRVQKSLSKAGFTTELVIGLNHSLCANFSSAICVADSMISSGNFSNILIATIDVFPDDFDRVGPGNLHIVSDCISSCIVSKSELEIEICNIYQAGLYNSSIMLGEVNKTPSDTLKYLITSLNKIKEIVQKNMGNVNHSILENHNEDYLKFIKSIFGIKEDSIFGGGEKELAEISNKISESFCPLFASTFWLRSPFELMRSIKAKAISLVSSPSIA